MGAQFVTFDNAVNAMPLLCRVLYEGAGLYSCTQKLFMSFLLPPPCGLSGGNYGKQICPYSPKRNNFYSPRISLTTKT